LLSAIKLLLIAATAIATMAVQLLKWEKSKWEGVKKTYLGKLSRWLQRYWTD